MGERKQSLNRRALLRNGDAGTVAYYVGSQLPAEAFASAALQDMPKPTAGADRPVNIGIIGTGNQGQYDLQQMVQVKGVKVLGVCDVYPPHLEKGLKIAGKDAKGY